MGSIVIKQFARVSLLDFQCWGARLYMLGVNSQQCGTFVIRSQSPVHSGLRFVFAQFKIFTALGQSGFIYIYMYIYVVRNNTRSYLRRRVRIAACGQLVGRMFN